MKSKLILTSLLALILHFPSEALSKPYFSGETISPKILAKPYEVGSKEWQDEIEQIIKIQKNIDKTQVKKAIEEREINSGTMILKIDSKFTRKNYPHLHKLLDRTLDTALASSSNAKGYWNIKRPYLVDKKVKLLIKRPGEKAYPSGHTTASFVWANVLSVLIPSKKKQFFEQAEAIANRRILVGVHYPSDIAAGKKLAEAIFKKLKQNENYQKDFSEAEKEVR